MARRLVLGLLVVVALVAAAIGVMYIRDSRDVEAVTIANLPGAANTTGLTKAEQQQYYHLTEGGEIYPIAALLALEAPDTADPSKLVPFLQTAERYGMLPDEQSPSNPYGLPVGVTVGQKGTLQMMGLNCTACHVGELRYQGKRFRMDGGPNLAFINDFVKGIVEQTKATFDPQNPERLARFSRRLRGARAEIKPLAPFPAVAVEYGSTDRGERPDPFSPVDDPLTYVRELARRIVNRDGIVQARLQSLRNAGFLTGSFLISPTDGFGRADAFGVGRNALFSGVESESLGFPRGTNSVPSDGPVSFPHIWGMQFTSWLQWGANTNSVMERNVGQSLGVGAAFDARDFTSTVRVDHLAALETLSYKIEAPRWPEDIFGPIDQDKAAAGKRVFDRTCALCHETYPKTPQGLKEYQLFPLHVVGTDPATALNFERLVMAPGPSGDLQAQPFGVAAFSIVRNVVNTYYERLNVPKDVQDAWEHRDARPEQTFRSTMRQTADFPDTQGLKVYRAKTLRGIWATAPFLHNGSVPTLYDLLLPVAQRPKSFKLGSREYDPVKLGYREDGPTPTGLQPFTVDTALPGNWNTGHEWWFYPELTDTDRYAVIEFLKTFWLPNEADYSFTPPDRLPADVRAPHTIQGRSSP
jgi:hypothetical protein